MKKKNLGFTLAEVLIVIGIIGVVAALTLPNLNHATGDKERVTKVKKIYSALTEAFDRAQAIYGDVDSWFNDVDCSSSQYIICNERYAKRVTEFMKISKDCELTENAGCFSADAVQNLDGSTSTSGDANGNVPFPAYRVVTADNMSLSLNYKNNSIIIDIDGPNKGQNKRGYDIFNIVIDYSDHSLNPCYVAPYGGDSYQIAQFFGSGYKSLCWIINTDNADYLKADSTGKCNDSNIVLDWTMTTNTSCH